MKITYLAVYYLLVGDTSLVSVFFLTKVKMSKQHLNYLPNYLVHIGLMLIISKVFTILCLLCLCGNRKYPRSFKKKAASSKLFQISSRLKREGRPF